jgi:hypothetical protein
MAQQVESAEEFQLGGIPGAPQALSLPQTQDSEMLLLDLCPMYMKLSKEPDVENRQVRFREELGMKFPRATRPFSFRGLKKL